MPVVRGEHGSDLSGSDCSGSGLSDFGFKILIPNPTEVFSDLCIFGFRIFGFSRVEFIRVRIDKYSISGLLPFLQTNSSIIKTKPQIHFANKKTSKPHININHNQTSKKKMQQIIKAPHSYMQKKISKPHIINQSKKCHKSLKPYIHLCKKNIIKHYRLGSYGSLWGVADAVGLSLGGRRWSKWRRWVSLSRSVFARRSGGGGSLSVGRHTAQSVVVVGLGRLS